MNLQIENRDGLTEAALARVGTVLTGKWRLDALLGIGGSAAVYAATHRNGHRVAIKVLHAHFSLDGGVRERLQQEGYVANLIDHPAAVRILDDDRADDGALFLVMELLTGEGLDARLRRKGWRLPLGESLGIAHALLDVLAAAHEKGVIHRDIKPDNVFVTREGPIKVLDFGIARLTDSPPITSGTHNGALFGTLGFMAPEQALGHTDEIDARTDLWAVGATLYTLLSGRLVHEAPTPNEQLVLAATRAAPPLASVAPEVHPATAALVDRALSFHPADRFQSAREMQEAVRLLMGEFLGPLEMPVLQGPRLSVELDTNAVNALRGPWTSSSFSSRRPSLQREPLAPTVRGFSAESSARWPKILVGAAGFAAVWLGLTLVRSPHVSRALMEGAPAVPSATPSEAPSTITPPPNASARIGTPPIASSVVRSPGRVFAELTAIAPNPNLASGASGDALHLHRRPLRRALGSTGPMPPAPAAANFRDDALWDRRH